MGKGRGDTKRCVIGVFRARAVTGIHSMEDDLQPDVFRDGHAYNRDSHAGGIVWAVDGNTILEEQYGAVDKIYETMCASAAAAQPASGAPRRPTILDLAARIADQMSDMFKNTHTVSVRFTLDTHHRPSIKYEEYERRYGGKGGRRAGGKRARSKKRTRADRASAPANKCARGDTGRFAVASRDGAEEGAAST